MNNKIRIEKKKIIKSIAQAKVGLIKKPKQLQIRDNKSEIIKIKPKSIIVPAKREKSVRELNAIRIAKTVELAKSGKRKIIRLNQNSVIRKDANYDKITNIKNVGVGKTLVMIACGPSILENDFSKLKDIPNIDIMVINKPLESVWPPKYWAFCDNSQHDRNKDAFNQYGGLIINSNVVKARKTNQIIVTAKATTGVSRNIHEGYVIGRSSVYANIQVALWMNYDKIFIFGVDMCAVSGKLHHYGVNPDVPESKRIERFKGEADNYNIMASKLPDEIRKRIYFCSSYNPFNFTTRFNKVSHIGAIDRIISGSI